MRAKKFPPSGKGTLREAHAQVADAATWASRMGFNNVAERLKWAAAVMLREVEDQDLTNTSANT